MYLLPTGLGNIRSARSLSASARVIRIGSVPANSTERDAGTLFHGRHKGLAFARTHRARKRSARILECTWYRAAIDRTRQLACDLIQSAPAQATRVSTRPASVANARGPPRPSRDRVLSAAGSCHRPSEIVAPTLASVAAIPDVPLFAPIHSADSGHEVRLELAMAACRAHRIPPRGRVGFSMPARRSRMRARFRIRRGIRRDE